MVWLGDGAGGLGDGGGPGWGCIVALALFLLQSPENEGGSMWLI